MNHRRSNKETTMPDRLLGECHTQHLKQKQVYLSATKAKEEKADPNELDFNTIIILSGKFLKAKSFWPHSMK